MHMQGTKLYRQHASYSMMPGYTDNIDSAYSIKFTENRNGYDVDVWPVDCDGEKLSVLFIRFSITRFSMLLLMPAFIRLSPSRPTGLIYFIRVLCAVPCDGCMAAHTRQQHHHHHIRWAAMCGIHICTVRKIKTTTMHWTLGYAPQNIHAATFTIVDKTEK